jgi:transposase
VEEKKRRKKRIFTEEFKREAVELIDKIGIPKAEQELDIGNSTLRTWRKKFQNPESKTLSGKKSYSELEKEIRRLSKENGYLKEINKVLKKSTAIFSSDQMGGLK